MLILRALETDYSKPILSIRSTGSRRPEKRETDRRGSWDCTTDNGMSGEGAFVQEQGK